MKVKIRGIYSTALTNLLKNKNVDVVQPSELMSKRMNIESNNESATTLIYDKDDLNGVIVSGKNSEKIIEILKDKLSDFVVKKLETGAIYCVTIKSTKSDKVTVDLGDEEGILTLQNYWGFLKEGEKVIAQVKATVNGKKILTTNLRIFGENAILIKNGFTKVSRHIKNNEERERIKKISEEIKEEGWGVLWKALAKDKDEETLKEELKRLYQKEKEIKEKFEKAEESQLIEEGLNVFYVDFGPHSKKELDRIRKKVVNTISGHHFLKSGGLNMLVDFAEFLENIDDNVILKKIDKVLEKNGPKQGMFYKIEHKKIGSKEIMFKGIIDFIENEEIVLKRRLKAGGRFDGIGGKIEQGDYAKTFFKPNSWVVKHIYFDKKNNQKGIYYNINTPIEVFPEFSRYIDLEIDVVEKNGSKKIVDKEKLESIKNKGLIKKEIAEKAVEIANQILKEEIK